MPTIRDGFFMLTLVALAVCGGSALSQKAEPAANMARSKFTIGKETTYVTEPLDKDGYPDYAAALNERLRAGVTPENNANVLLWQTVGPRSEILEPAKFFKALGIPEPPKEGDYFVDSYQYEKKYLKVDPDTPGVLQKWCEPLRYKRRPWASKEYPDLAAWLKLNEKHLARIVEASKRTHYYSPVLPRQTEKGPTPLSGSLRPEIGPLRTVAEALIARAMLRAGEGDADAAWQDLLAVHRLGRLVGRGASLVDGLVAQALNGIGCTADLEFLNHTTPNAKQIEGYLADLRKLPPLPEAGDKIDFNERIFLLEAMLRVHRLGLSAVLTSVGDEPDPVADRVLDGVDWDATLRHANRWYDRLVAVMREKDRATREKKLDEIEAELNPLKSKLLKPDAGELGLFLLKPAELAKVLPKEPKDRSNVLGDFMVLLVTPALRTVSKGFDRGAQSQDNVNIAFALAWYQRVQGSYPADLAALSPKYLPKLPLDRFSGKVLIYRPAANGYLFYSVGPNGLDEDGRGLTDDPPGDDISVRMPLPKPPAR